MHSQPIFIDHDILDSFFDDPMTDPVQMEDHELIYFIAVDTIFMGRVPTQAEYICTKRIFEEIEFES